MRRSQRRLPTLVSMTQGDGNDGLRLELQRSPEGLAETWDRLADSLAAPPFMRPGWITAWARAFAPGGLRALTATRGEDLVGVLPFIERRGVRSAPVNWHTPVFGFLAAEARVSAALAERFVSEARVRVDLGFLDARDPNVAQCSAAAARLGRSVIVREVLRSPYVQLADSDWESYPASLDRKFRKGIGRRRRRLDEQGSVSIEMANGDEDLESLLEEGFRLEASGWKHDRGSAITSNAQTQRFYMDIARWAKARGWLLMAFLRVDGSPIAFDLCLQCNGVIYVLKGGFDPEFRRFGPGTLLTYESLRVAFERGATSYELLGADEPYKLEWTQTVRKLVRFQAFSRTAGGRLNHLAWSRGRSAVRRALALAARSRRKLRA